MFANFSYGAARVTCEKLDHSTIGLMQIAYYGPIGKQAFAYLRDAIVIATAHADAVVIRMDYAVFTLDCVPEIPAGTYSTHAPAAAVIVRRDAHALWSGYARALSRMKIKRAVFPDSQAVLAYEWAADHACLAREQLLQ